MSNEIGNTPADKGYQPSGISRAEEAAQKAYPVWMVKRRYDGIARSDDPYDSNLHDRYCFKKGYEQAEKDLALKFKELREAQKKWKKTLNYGWRCEAVRLEKEVDELLNEMQDGE